MSDPVDPQQMFLDLQLQPLVEQYNQSRNGIFIWQAFQICREWGAPVREDILKALDGMAAKLMQASGRDEILGALQLAKPIGGAQAVTAAHATASRHQIARVFATLRQVGFSYTEAVRITADHMKGPLARSDDEKKKAQATVRVQLSQMSKKAKTPTHRRR